MSIQLNFEIQLNAEYHVGSGHGDGLVDTLLLRDGDGVPVIRGSSITGLLRDALYQLLQQPPLAEHAGWCQASGAIPKKGEKSTPEYCGQFYEHAENPCPICRIFGTPATPKRWRISSARPQQHLNVGKPGLGTAVGGHIVQRARISPRSRRTEAHKLFSNEQGAASWNFVFTVTAATDEPGSQFDAALLVAAARAVRGFGSARRRGQGECRIHLQNRAQEDTWMQAFQSHWLNGQPVKTWPTSDSDSPALIEPPKLVPTNEEATRKRVRILARTEEPLILSRRGEAGNNFESVELIPGSILLGALANRVAQRYNLETDAQAKETFVQLFLRERVRFSALLPAEYDHDYEKLRPTIPAPLDMLTCKAFPGFSKDVDCQHTVAGYAGAEDLPSECPDCAKKKNPDVPLKPLKGFIVLKKKPQTYQPQRRHEMHIQVDPQTGRVHEQNLFGYVCLEAGQYFIGEIICADEAAWTALQTMAALPEPGNDAEIEINIGRASRRGHGRVRLLLSEAGQTDPWRGLALSERVPDTSKPSTLVMTLLSDTILPATWGGARVGFTETWLSKLLKNPVKIVRAFARSRNIDGFFGHLGLPRFRDVALSAGSAVGFQFVNGPPADLDKILKRIERDGVGLRRNEGYGQVVFNHPLYTPALHEKLAGTSVEVPKSFCPPQPVSGRSMPLGEFRKDWAEELYTAANTSPWQHESFAEIARMVQCNAASPLAVLIRQLMDKQMLTDQGIQTLVAKGVDETLLNTITSQLEDSNTGFGQAATLLEYDLGSTRVEKKHVRATRAGRQKIIVLLSALEKHVEHKPELRRIGREMLAEYIAQGAEHARQARQDQSPQTKKEAAA